LIPHSQPNITPSELLAMQEVLNSAMLSSGENTAELEKQLAAYLNKNHALMTGNGSQAQVLILMALGIGPGKEVILPSYVCDKVYKAVEITGAKPVLVDIGLNWLMEPNNVVPYLQKNTAAIILPHVYGYNAWQQGFEQFNVPIIEDICQSLGHNHLPFRTGTYTDFAFTSFHGTKPLAAGEGGMVFVNDEKVFGKLVQIRNSNPLFTKSTEMVASLALSQLNRYADVLKRRGEIAAFYNNNIESALTESSQDSLVQSMHFRYILKSNKDFEVIKAEYYKAGIHVRKGVDNLIHREIGLSDDTFPNSTNSYNTTVSIPLLPQLTQAQCEHIVATTNDLFKAGVL
jgi:perosamine synthetase